MAKIAVELERALARRAASGAAGGTSGRKLASGDGWSVADVVCTAGPRDRPFEERHENFSVAIVTAGSFQYRGPWGLGTERALMTPGSLLLGSADQCFECGHEHAAGDRCLSFSYAPEYFERLAADAGVRGRLEFGVLRLPPLRKLSLLVARACSRLAGLADVSWEELSLELAARAVQIARDLPAGTESSPPSAVARVTRVVREMSGAQTAISRWGA
ncbi:MAG: hypothetical protein ACRD9L_20860 [Bryobacteraceae bacterium]